MYRQGAAVVWVACCVAGLAAAQRSTMTLELIVPRDLYLTGENISLDVRLTNTGAAAIDVPGLKSPDSPQPSYRLQGPSYPNGVTFNHRDSRPGVTSVPVTAPSTLRLDAGETMEAGFNLNTLQPISQPGEYTISARFDWQGWSAEAAPVRFQVEKATFIAASLGMDAFARSARQMRAVWLAQSERGRVLGESFLYEGRPDLGEVAVTGTRIIRQVAATATDPFCPWINFDRTDAEKFWHGWRDGSRLFAFSDDEGEPRSADLGSKDARVVRPTVMNRAGDLDVLVLADNQTTLRLIRFPHTSGPPIIVWSTELPEKALAARLAVGPQQEGGSLVAAAVSRSGDGIAIRLIRIGSASAEVGPPVPVDRGFALPESEPGVRIDADGTVHASVLFARDPGRRSLAVFDVTALRGGQPQGTVAGAGDTDAEVVRAWTTYAATLEGPPARRWLIRTASGAAGGGATPTPVDTPGPVVDFLRMSAGTYALVIDATAGPRLVATPF